MADPDDSDYGICNTADYEDRDEVKKNVGSIYITGKVDVGVDYIVTPSAPETMSLEITGQDLSYSKDRIMVIDCFGTCGVTGPSEHISLAEAGSFNDWVAVNALIDRPALQENPRAADPAPEAFTYTSMDDKYCPGSALDIQTVELASNHQCYKKCYTEQPCLDPAVCFCDGFYPGHDTTESSALCLDEEQCTWLCSHIDGCHSIDMHDTDDRCFLNTDSCQDLIENDQLVPDDDYHLVVKQRGENQRRLQKHGRALSADQVRKLLAAEDPRISWEDILRFKGINFNSGGEFKLCFCDSDLLTGANAICDGPEDYTIEVGSVHATGLQCLLSNPKMARGTCVDQEYNGLRCYDDEIPLPNVTIPTDYLGVPNPADTDWSDMTHMLMSFCRFGDPIAAAQFDFCAQYQNYADPNQASQAMP